MIVSVRVKNKSYFNHKTRGGYPMGGVATPFFITNFLFIVVAVTFNTSRNSLVVSRL